MESYTTGSHTLRRFSRGGSPLGGIANFNLEPLAECRERSFDLVEPRAMPQREQSFDVRLRDPNAPENSAFLRPELREAE